MKTKPGMVVMGILILVVAGGLFIKHSVPSRTAKNSHLTARALTRPPAVVKRPMRRPPPSATTASARRSGSAADNDVQILKALLNGTRNLKLSPVEVERYLNEHGRSAANLLAAFQASGDNRYLKDAAAAFPDDPHVQFLVLALNALSEDRAQWVTAFQHAAPDNRLASFFAALDGFKNNQPANALQEMVAAASKTSYEDYLLDHSVAAEALYLGAGRTELEAKLAATFGLLLPHLSMMRDLSRELGMMEASAMASGDLATAQTAASVGLGLAQQITEGSSVPTYVNEMVGQAIERQFLATADAAVVEQVLGQTAAERLAELDRQRNDIRQTVAEWSARVETGEFSAGEMAEYFDRVRYAGEPEANRWMLSLQRTR
ncbi:MAG: hypothetical protein WA117_05710 [Verrucomicrobiia bacterium]